MTAILTDPHLRQCLADIVRQAKVSCIVETGTNVGDSTAVFAEMVPTVFSIESDNKLFIKSCTRFHGQKHVHLIHGSSDSVLACCMKPILAHGLRDGGNALFCLDAHWGEEWPLLNELREINMRRQELRIGSYAEPGKRFVLLIDDWFIDGHPQFAGCYGGLRSDDSKGREHELQPCNYEAFAAELDSWPHFYEPIYPEGGIGYCIASDFELELGENFRRVR